MTRMPGRLRARTPDRAITVESAPIVKETLVDRDGLGNDQLGQHICDADRGASPWVDLPVRGD